MTRFVETTTGHLINLAFVRKIYPHRVREAGKANLDGRISHYTIHLDGGGEYGVPGYALNVEGLTSELIPATSGTKACIISVDDTDRPTTKDVWVEWMPILAWRFRAGSTCDPDPVLPEGGSDGRILIELPDGKLLSVMDRTYDDLDDAKVTILAMAQGDWDAKQARKAKEGTDG